MPLFALIISSSPFSIHPSDLPALPGSCETCLALRGTCLPSRRLYSVKSRLGSISIIQHTSSQISALCLRICRACRAAPVPAHRSLHLSLCLSSALIGSVLFRWRPRLQPFQARCYKRQPSQVPLHPRLVSSQILLSCPATCSLPKAKMSGASIRCGP